jgi:hypothetical protein
VRGSKRGRLLGLGIMLEMLMIMQEEFEELHDAVGTAA